MTEGLEVYEYMIFMTHITMSSRGVYKCFLTYYLNICIKSQPFIMHQQVEELVCVLQQVYVTGVHV